MGLRVNDLNRHAFCARVDHYDLFHDDQDREQAYVIHVQRLRINNGRRLVRHYNVHGRFQLEHICQYEDLYAIRVREDKGRLFFLRDSILVCVNRMRIRLNKLRLFQFICRDNICHQAKGHCGVSIVLNYRHVKRARARHVLLRERNQEHGIRRVVLKGRSNGLQVILRVAKEGEACVLHNVVSEVFNFRASFLVPACHQIMLRVVNRVRRAVTSVALLYASGGELQDVRRVTNDELSKITVKVFRVSSATRRRIIRSKLAHVDQTGQINRRNSNLRVAHRLSAKGLRLTRACHARVQASFNVLTVPNCVNKGRRNMRAILLVSVSVDARPVVTRIRCKIVGNLSLLIRTRRHALL